MNSIAISTWRHLRPASLEPSWEWISQHGRNWHGQRFDPGHMPWARGVCEAWDNPAVREVVLQWSARLGKTIIAHNLLCYVMAKRPANILEAGPTEKIVLGWTSAKLYPMLDAMAADGVPITLPPEHRRSAREIEFGSGLLKAAWAGSDSALADFDCTYAHMGELSKWPQEASSESDTVAQAEKRTHAHPDRKIIKESTPTFRGRCRIEKARKAGNDCRYWVPCPHCGTYQVLKGPPAFGSKGGRHGAPIPDRREGGIIWQLDADGRHDPELAFATAVFVCPHCDGDVLDVHRPAMMRAGVWCPRGQHVDAEGQLRGTPLRSSRIWSSQLASWYSLDFRWGDIAELWVNSYRGRETRKTFVQLTAGETYEHEEVLTDTDVLAETLRGGVSKSGQVATAKPRGIVPSWARLLVFTSDVQADTWPWCLVALGPEPRNDRDAGDDLATLTQAVRTHLVDYGTALSWSELDELIGRTYAVENGGQIGVRVVGCDSGHQTGDVYDWCRARHRKTRPVYPLKGSSGNMAGKPYAEVRLGQDTRARRKASIVRKGQRLLHVNTDFWEEAIANHFELGTATACEPACSDEDLLAELLNATVTEKSNSHGVVSLLWCKRDDTIPNDHRDAWRYALCLGAFFVIDKCRGRWPAVGLVKVDAPAPSPPAATTRRAAKAGSRLARIKGRLAGRLNRRGMGRRR